MVRKNGRTPDPERSTPAPARTPLPRSGALNLPEAAGNTAMIQMLRQAGHPWAQAAEPAGPEQHRHGAGCGHRADPSAGATEAAPVQRSTVHDVLSTPGRPLDDHTRTDMESRLGADFTDVRIHDDSAARASAGEIGARAYTSGSHVVIGAGGGDKHTLAHELTHVIQQRQGPVAGSDHGDGLRVSDPSDRFEREAEANATRVMRAPAVETVAGHGTHPRAQDGARTASVQRMPFNPNGKQTAGPPPKQGDHLFNKLADAADQLATNAEARLAAVFAGTGKAVKIGLRDNPDLFRAQRAAFLAKLPLLREKAAEARRERHPDSYPQSLFYAAEGVVSQAGGDTNSTTFGTFSATLAALPERCGTTAAGGAVQALTLPPDVAAARGGWGNLSGKVYDADAERRVRNALKGIEKGRHQKKFTQWVGETQGIYVDLYALMMETVEALQAVCETILRGGAGVAGTPAAPAEATSATTDAAEDQS
ncbi:DUF4157 domain-containing protein [Streptomyces sp. NPDC051079]|uniref:eCIS core domain-containing protein n=1 Tax=unclassified Streptomyces TaxID=2593676 RepID=UPI00344EE588